MEYSCLLHVVNVRHFSAELKQSIHSLVVASNSYSGEPCIAISMCAAWANLSSSPLAIKATIQMDKRSWTAVSISTIERDACLIRVNDEVKWLTF